MPSEYKRRPRINAGNFSEGITSLESWTLSTGVECEEGEIRLVGGVTNSSGRLEVCANGMWGRVCNALQYWGPANARVVCRQLGFLEQG